MFDGFIILQSPKVLSNKAIKLKKKLSPDPY